PSDPHPASLSLHDALPILSRRDDRPTGRTKNRSGYAAAIDRTGNRRSEPELRRRPELRLSRYDFMAKPDLTPAHAEQPSGCFRTDRKSTRLNSSHVAISYA